MLKRTDQSGWNWSRSRSTRQVRRINRAAAIFGVSGGVAEAAIRTAYQMVTGEELPVPDFTPVRGLPQDDCGGCQRGN